MKDKISAPTILTVCDISNPFTTLEIGDVNRCWENSITGYFYTSNNLRQTSPEAASIEFPISFPSKAFKKSK